MNKFATYAFALMAAALIASAFLVDVRTPSDRPETAESRSSSAPGEPDGVVQRSGVSVGDRHNDALARSRDDVQSDGADGIDTAILEIHERSRDELIELIAGVSDHLPDELSEFESLSTFAEHLLRIARNDPEDPIFDESPVYGDISFSTTNQTSMGSEWRRSQFDERTSRIVANLPEIENLGVNVFVAWSKQGSDEFIVFRNMAVDPTLRKNSVWIHNPTGWEPGTYQVSVYSADERLTLLANGRYRIVPGADSRAIPADTATQG